jgi:hypothetical protein
MAALLEIAKQSVDLRGLPGTVNSGKADNYGIARFHFGHEFA